MASTTRPKRNNYVCLLWTAVAFARHKYRFKLFCLTDGWSITALAEADARVHYPYPLATNSPAHPARAVAIEVRRCHDSAGRGDSHSPTPSIHNLRRTRDLLSAPPASRGRSCFTDTLARPPHSPPSPPLLVFTVSGCGERAKEISLQS